MENVQKFTGLSITEVSGGFIQFTFPDGFVYIVSAGGLHRIFKEDILNSVSLAPLPSVDEKQL